MTLQGLEGERERGQPSWRLKAGLAVLESSSEDGLSKWLEGGIQWGGQRGGREADICILAPPTTVIKVFQVRGSCPHFRAARTEVTMAKAAWIGGVAVGVTGRSKGS